MDDDSYNAPYDRMKLEEDGPVTMVTSNKLHFGVKAAVVLLLLGVLLGGITTGFVILRKEYVSLIEEVARMKNISEQGKKISEERYIRIQEKYVSLNAEMTQIRNISEQGNDVFQSLQMEIGMAKQEEQKLSKLEALEQQLEKMKQAAEEKQKQLQAQLTKLNTTIAFTVYMDNGNYNPSKNELIPFNRVVTNIGNHYSMTSRKFHCPVRGIYAFWFSLFARYKPKTGVQLMLDNNRLSEAYCKNFNTNQVSMMCGNNAVTVCETGSEVWVQSEYDDTVVYGGTHRESTFSGFILREL